MFSFFPFLHLKLRSSAWPNSLLTWFFIIFTTTTTQKSSPLYFNYATTTKFPHSAKINKKIKLNQYLVSFSQLALLKTTKQEIEKWKSINFKEIFFPLLTSLRNFLVPLFSHLLLVSNFKAINFDSFCVSASVSVHSTCVIIILRKSYLFPWNFLLAGDFFWRGWKWIGDNLSKTEGFNFWEKNRRD